MPPCKAGRDHTRPMCVSVKTYNMWRKALAWGEEIALTRERDGAQTPSQHPDLALQDPRLPGHLGALEAGTQANSAASWLQKCGKHWPKHLPLTLTTSECLHCSRAFQLGSYLSISAAFSRPSPSFSFRSSLHPTPSPPPPMTYRPELDLCMPEHPPDPSAVSASGKSCEWGGLR